MVRCKNCKNLIAEEDLLTIKDDPSAKGISLAPGYYNFTYCPCCGEEIAESDSFSLIDELDITEGAFGEVHVSLEGKGVTLWLDDSGKLCFAEYERPKQGRAEKEVRYDAA